MEPGPQLSRLRWRCRRGMRELDQLLLRWLEANASSADAVSLRSFDDLLDAEDSDLWAWAVGRAQPQRADWQVLIEQIRSPAEP